MGNRDTQCPQCQSEQIEFDPDYGYYRCQTCEAVWANAKDDPDMDEAEGFAEVMEQVYQTDPQYWAKLQEGRSGGFDD